MADSNKLVVYAALLGNLAIALVKFIAAYLTNSSAMLSEAIHCCGYLKRNFTVIWIEEVK